VAIFGDTDVPQAIETAAQKMGAHLWRLEKEFGFKLSALNNQTEIKNNKKSQPIVYIEEIKTPTSSPNPSQWDFFAPQQTRSSLPFPALRGSYQLNNASAALAALCALKEKLPLSMEAVRRGLLEVTLTARFQILPGKPNLILDVAHNPQAARALASNLAALPTQGKTFAVCAMLKDKDISGVVTALKSQVDVWLLAGLDVPRGATVEGLAKVLQTAAVNEIHCFASISDALHHAYNQAGDNDRIAAFGSFYTVAEVMRSRGLPSS
jgi:dihydrofolate synthase/folylpolyglutamate synthase